MPMNGATAVSRVTKLLEDHAKLVDVVKGHQARVEDATRRLEDVEGDLEMYSQHRAVSDELREKVSAALKAFNSNGAESVDA